MSDIIVSQKEIEDLISSLSWEDRIEMSYEKVNNYLGIILKDSPNQEILRLRRDLNIFIKNMLIKKDDIHFDFDSIFLVFKEIKHNLLMLTENVKLFQILVELENMLILRFYDITKERRKSIRFPIQIDGILTIEEKEIPATLADISSSGIKLTFTEKIERKNDFYFFKFKTSIEQCFEIMLLYIKEGFISDDFIIYTSGAVLKNNISTDEIKEIIYYYHNKIEIDYQLCCQENR